MLSEKEIKNHIEKQYENISLEERKRLEAEIKQENRDGKIDSIVEGKEFTEKTIKDHPDYKPGPKSHLMYLDYVYGGATSSK